jgi:ATP-dependent DNA helicase DinG
MIAFARDEAGALSAGERTWLREAGLGRVVAVDLETTGLDDHCEIVEIGAQRLVDGVETDSFREFVRPEAPLPPRIARLTGIDPRRLRRARPLSEVLPAFFEWAGDDPLLAHNLKFDLGMLRRWAARLGLGWRPPALQLDTVPLGQTLLPTLASHRLAELARHLGADHDSAHRAYDDARATAQVLLGLLRIAWGLELPLLRSLALLARGSGDVCEALFEGLLERRRRDAGPGDWRSAQPPLRSPLLLKEALDRSDPAGAADLAGGMPAWFGPEGRLRSSLDGFRVREPQLLLAEAAREALDGGGLCLAEAATGTGKSFAYLLPAMLRGRALCAAGERGVVISTQTRNLQDQLFDKDIPRLSRLLAGPLKAVLLKGRGNYLCGRRLARLLDEAPQRLSQAERLTLLPVVVWAALTRSGDIEECTGFRPAQQPGLWSQLRSEGSVCRDRACRADAGCWAGRWRREAVDAQLIVVNHSLLLADLEVEGGVLGDYRQLILDEAHNFARSAEQQLRRSFSFGVLLARLRSLHDPAEDGKGLLRQLLRAAMGDPGRGEDERLRLQTAFAALAEAGDRLLEPLQAYREALNAAQRERHEGAVRGGSRYTQKLRFGAADHPLRPFHELHRSAFAGLPDWEQAAQAAQGLLAELEEASRPLPEAGELEAGIGQLRDSLLALDDLAEAGEGEDEVCWVEVHPASFESVFHRCPLDPGGALRERLWSRLDGALLTSATLAVGGRFDYIEARLGLDSLETPPRRLLLPSPFDLERQARVFVPAWLPDSGPRSLGDFSRETAALIARIAEEFDRGQLVLFTSYTQLGRVYDELLERLDWQRTPLLVQGQGASRHELLESFRAAGNAVLLGVDSFWEGVDVPGDALQVLLMAKLPFEVPSEPLVQARSERIQRRGGNAFLEFQVPEAVIRFRQGLGRLIRHESDRGAFLLLDTRAVQKSYGELFLQAAPGKALVHYREDDLVKALNNFLR